IQNQRNFTGAQAAFVGDATDQIRIIHQNRNLTASGMQQSLAAAAQDNVTVWNLNITTIDHLRRQQYHSVLGVNGAVVFDSPYCATAKGVAPGEKVLVGHVQSGDHQAADVDLRPIAEHDAIRVDQINLAIGIERAVDFRQAIAQYPVERHR